MTTTSFSQQTPQASQATGYVQADGFYSPLVAGVPSGTSSEFSQGPANFPYGTNVQTATGITAAAGGGQTNATLVTADWNNVTTVATAANSIKLPASYVGAQCAIQNSGANSLQVFGTGTDTINGIAYGTGEAIAAGKTAILTCYVKGNWIGPVALA